MTKPKRKSVRVKWDAYQNGCYFVTICTQHKIHYFGEIKHQKMYLSPLGTKLQKIIKNTPLIRPDQHIEIVHFTIMPNHLHFIMTMNTELEHHQHYFGSQRKNLSSVVRGIKCALTSFANKHHIPFKWQSRYHEHIIKDDKSFEFIYNYIENNVIAWEQDCFY